MVNSVIGICDTNTVYMKKLAEYFMQKSVIPLQIMTFSETSQLIRYLKKERLDILITGGDVCVDDHLNQLCGTDAGMNTGQRKGGIKSYVKWRIELVDLITGIESTDHFVFQVSRYGSSAELLQLIEQLAASYEEGAMSSDRHIQEDKGYYKIGLEESTYTEENITGKKRVFRKVIGIYSPVNRCGKTSLAVLLAELLGRKRSALMISMDHYSDFSDGELNLAELIYCMSRENTLRTEQKTVQDFSEYERFVKQWQDISYIPAPQSAEDIAQISALQLCHLADLLEQKSSYYYIIFDLSEGMEELPLVLKRCHIIFMPVLDDCISRRKREVFEQNMSAVMESEEWALLSEKIYQIQLPETIEAENMDHYYKELIWSNLGTYASRLLEQYRI